jgi:very-short-patch-repair endonuclease
VANAVRKQKLREAIADAIAENVKAYDVAAVCVDLLGLEPAAPGEDPFHSKRVYVRGRLLDKSIPELETMAYKIIEEYGDEYLEQLLAQLGMTGVAGELKNLIFAANGPKPRIVLQDAINNVIEITENAEYCLVFDQPLTGAGLSWRELTAWWTLKQGLTGSERDRARSLYRRLDESMDGNEAERLVFKTYAELYARADGFDLPALIPQVYLHYDPYTRRERGGRGPLVRQRMDFLLLVANRGRIVIEVDGRQHYAESDGRANPARYAEMVKEDRSLRLAGYEVYRFGAKELMDGEASRDLVRQFFASLLEKHRSAAET